MSGRRLVRIWIGAWIVCILTGAGCTDKDKVPNGILPRDKMQEVMWDMTQADQYAALYVAKDSLHSDRKAETMRLYEEVFRLHQVTREEFKKSYQYYLDHPELSQLLFDSVIAQGVRARSEAYDRPGAYRLPVVPPRPGVVPGAASKPGVVPGRPGAVTPVVPGRPGGVLPGRPGGMMPVVPGGLAGEAIRRAREAAERRQDSLRRLKAVKRDTTRGEP